MTTTISNPRELGTLLSGEAAALAGWAGKFESRRCAFHLAVIVVGAGLYGAAMGWWRDPMQALYVGIKFPLIILLTTLGNALLNAMLAPLLGLNITLRQSLGLVLFGFAVTALILGALSPVALFLVWNTPPLNAATQLTSPEYGFLQLTLAVFIAATGITGCARLWPLLREWAGSALVGGRVLFAWLLTNLFLGSQICWVLRPFIWDPDGPPRFIGQEYLRGSFFETVFAAALRLVF